MRIIVLSDTHQYYRNFETIVLRHPDADMFIHLGDGESEYQLLCRNMPEVADKFRYIKGNCDYGSEAPLTQTIDLMPGHRVFATLEEGCDIALYGHTHVSQCTYENGIYVMNPGSASCPRDGNPPSYGILDVSSAGVMTNVVFLETKTRF